jgi:hypothetical protein
VSRSGYSDDCENAQLWRTAVSNAIRGKRGQAFLREMLEALDAMPDKRLIHGQLREAEGGVCAMGAVGAKRGMQMDNLDVCDPRRVADAFGIARVLAAEIAFENDEGVGYWMTDEDDGKRWQRMRDWVACQITKAP